MNVFTEAQAQLAVAIAIRMLRTPSLAGPHAGAMLANLLEEIVPFPSQAGGGDMVRLIDVRARQIAEVVAGFGDNHEENTARASVATRAWREVGLEAVRKAQDLGRQGC